MSQNGQDNLVDLVYSYGNLLAFVGTTDMETMEEYTQIYYNSSPVVTIDKKLHKTIIKFREGIEFVKNLSTKNTDFIEDVCYEITKQELKYVLRHPIKAASIYMQFMFF